MKSRILTTAAVFAAMLILSPTSAGVTTQFTGNNDNDWNDAGNWDNGIPTEADRAVIPDTKTCNVDTSPAYADTIEVEEGGTLNIPTSTILVLDNDNGPTANSVVNGTVNLQSSGAILRLIEEDHAISGAGTIVGADPAAKIEIGTGGSSPRLTSTTTIEGTLQIVNGTFFNNGTVEANATTQNYVLEIYPDVLGGSGYWNVTTNAYAELWFRTGSTSLTGQFMVSNGTLDVDDHVETTNNLTFSGGKIEVAANKRFVANK
jgi:hypothetical protein